MNRRRFLTGAGLFVAAPAIIRTPGLLMPVKPALIVPDLIIPLPIGLIAYKFECNSAGEFVTRGFAAKRGRWVEVGEPTVLRIV